MKAEREKSKPKKLIEKEEEEMAIEKKYQKKSPLEHILLRPDTYIGSAEEEKEKLWIYDETMKKLIHKEIVYVPGLYKIFDEILVNAADHFENNATEMTYVKVVIDRENNKISVTNNGPGIPVKIHKDEGIYVPELIFGHLLTSSNYDDTIKRTTGGRNGYGAKLTNIFSKEFTIETLDSKEMKEYKQTFKNNMTVKGEPKITSVNAKKSDSYTRITFVPDLARFKLKGISDDFYYLLVKRVYDLAGVTNSSLKVYLNGEKIEVKDFKSYVQLYLDSTKKDDDSESEESEEEESTQTNETGKSKKSKKEKKKKILDFVYCSPHPRWELAMAVADDHFQQVSFVNSICTNKGGTHVNFFCEKLTTHIIEQIEKKDKKLTVKPAQVKSHLWVFVNCRIENPMFDGQTKDTLTLKASSFGSTYDLPEKFLKDALKTGILEHCISYAKTKENLKVMKQLNQGVKKSGKVLGIPKLEDANLAGSKRSHECVLILTEGDSAKSLAMAGLEVVGRDRYGVFPLKGKLLNVRDAPNKKILNNDEIQNLIKIIGLNVGKNYEDVSSLRYGSVMIMTDQDHDGSHIKGLIINFIQNYWSSLFQMNGFIKQFITPIIKMTKGSRVESFYTLTDYRNFVNVNLKGSSKGWKIKYYKGLGTSTDKEAKEYFNNIDNNEIDFEYQNVEDEESVIMAFAKDKATERKNWLARFDPVRDVIDSNLESVRYKDFINKELVHFSNSDNYRSIPCICDGLKPSERKILFSCFKRKLKDEIKVAQLCGYIAEHSAYHHGEVSLQMTIVAMAQNFVGSNNVNLLMPLGQFGSRALGGKDHASARYIFTNLNKITRHLFHENDDPLMDYLVEENQRIEPQWYLPILPMILINGAQGIGSGWSTLIPCYSPYDIADSFIKKLNGENFTDLTPYYKGFTGDVEKEGELNNASYYFYGKYHWNEDDELEITELPIGVWTRNYKIMLESYMGIVHKNGSKDKGKKKEKGKKKKEEDDEDDSIEGKKCPHIIEDFKEYHTTNRVHFKIKFLKDYEKELKEDEDKLIKVMKLKGKKSCSNMVLFDKDGKLKKYKSTIDIMEDFFNLRRGYYTLRKDYLLSIIKRDLELLSNKARFILAVVNGELEVKKRKKNEIINDLVKMKFTPMSKIKSMVIYNPSSTSAQSFDKEQADKEDKENENYEDSDDDNINSISNSPKMSAKEFNYLLEMPIWSLTYERVEAIKQDKEKKEGELKSLEKTTENEMWSTDIKKFVSVLEQIEKEEEEERLEADTINKKGGKGKPKMKRKNAQKKRHSEDEEKPKKNKKDKEKDNGEENKKKDKKEKENVEDKEKTNKITLKDVKSDAFTLTEEELYKLPLAERLRYKQASTGILQRNPDGMSDPRNKLPKRKAKADDSAFDALYEILDD